MWVYIYIYICIRVSGGLYRDNGKENGNYYNGLYRIYWDDIGLYMDNEKENGNYHIIMGYILGYSMLGFKLEVSTLGHKDLSTTLSPKAYMEPCFFIKGIYIGA